jgi:hypothetical protein
MTQFQDLDAQARAVLADCAPLQARFDTLTAEIDSLKAALKPLAADFQKRKAPLVEIENERAALSRALGGKTGLFDREETAPRTVQRPPNRTPTPFEYIETHSHSHLATPDHDARSHMTPDQLKRLELIESQNLQAMQALQALLQVMEDERGKRENLQKIVLRIAEGADDLLKRAG